MAIAYTPGVAAPCLEIEKDESLAYTYTGKGNTVAVITDGTAVLGLGDIGPSAGMLKTAKASFLSPITETSIAIITIVSDGMNNMDSQ